MRQALNGQHPLVICTTNFGHFVKRVKLFNEVNNGCLDFHKTERNIRTASVTQVRKLIYKTSVERWRSYEDHLGPLFEALGDLAPER